MAIRDYNPYIDQCRSCFYWRSLGGTNGSACHYRIDNDHGPKKEDGVCHGHKTFGTYKPKPVALSGR